MGIKEDIKKANAKNLPPRDSQQSNGLSSQSTGEQWEEWEHEQGGQAHDVFTHWNSWPELAQQL